MVTEEGQGRADTDSEKTTCKIKKS